MLSDYAENFIVTLDEPENHLHPEMQQQFLPSFLQAFPQAQFVVGTHSPLIVNSEPNSNVYMLDYAPDGLVVTQAQSDLSRSGGSGRGTSGFPWSKKFNANLGTIEIERINAFVHGARSQQRSTGKIAR